MRKQQLENLKVGDKVQEYGKEAIYTVVIIPQEEGQKYRVMIPGETIKELSANTVLKNFKLVEEEIAVTVEEPGVMDIVGYLNQGIEEEPEIRRGIDKIDDPETKSRAIKAAKNSIKKMKEKREATKVENSDEITASQLAEELGITPQDLRRQLRKNKFTKPEQGWKWNKDSEEFKTVLTTLKQIQEKRAEKRRG